MILDFTNLSAQETKRLNNIADAMKGEYTLFVDEYCKKYGEDYLFWATPFVSRNIYHDDTFLHLCRIRLALDLIDEGSITGITPETIGEYRTLKAVAGNRVNVFCPPSVSVITKMKGCINRLRQYTNFFMKIAMYIKCSDRTRYSYPEHLSVVIGFVTSADFDGYAFHDNYMPGIEDCHENVMFLSFIVNNGNMPYRTLFNKIKNCSSHRFIYNSSLIRMSDLIEIFRYWRVIYKAKKGSYYFNNLDVSGIIRESLTNGRNNSSAFEGLIMRKMIQRMRNETSGIDNFIIWYEGQPKDVIVSSAIREFFPESNYVGYQGRPLVEILLSDFISEYQYRLGYSPKVMAVPSKEYEYEAHQFCPGIPLIFVPPLRIDYELSRRTNNIGIGRTVLVVLPILEEVAREELLMLNDYLRNKRDYRVVIKNHPTKRQNTVYDYGVESLCFEPEYVKGKLSECLEGVDVVVASSTTSGLEILYAGIPLIVVCPRGRLGYAAMPARIKEKMCHIVYGYEELEFAMDETLKQTGIDNEILDGLMIPKSPKAFELMFA